MVELLRAELERHQGKMRVTYSLNNGDSSDGDLISVDDVGLALRNHAGLCFYPWGTLKRILINGSATA